MGSIKTTEDALLKALEDYFGRIGSLDRKGKDEASVVASEIRKMISALENSGHGNDTVILDGNTFFRGPIEIINK